MRRRLTRRSAWKGLSIPVRSVAGDNRILVKVTHGGAAPFGFSLALVDDGLETTRTTHVPHPGKQARGEPVSLTGEMKRRSSGGDTLPGEARLVVYDALVLAL